MPDHLLPPVSATRFQARSVGAAEESVTPRDGGGDGEAVAVAVGAEVGLADARVGQRVEELSLQDRKPVMAT